MKTLDLGLPHFQSSRVPSDNIDSTTAVTGEADKCQPYMPQQWSNLSYSGRIYVIRRYLKLAFCMLIKAFL